MAEEQRPGFGWGKGCAIGCAVVLLILVVAGVAIWILVQRGMDSAREATQAQVLRAYANFQEQVEITAEQEALIEDLVTHSQRDDIGFAAVLVSGGTVLVVLDDGVIDDEDVALMQDVKTEIDANPDPGWVEMGELMNQHPELQQKMQNLQGSGGVVVDEPAVEEPALGDPPVEEGLDAPAEEPVEEPAEETLEEPATIQ
jgi:hypothetical protein